MWCKEATACAFLQVKYMVDMTLQRYMLHLGSTEHQDYAAGNSSMQFAVPKTDMGGLKKSWLNNVGLLLVCLWFCIIFAHFMATLLQHTR